MKTDQLQSLYNNYRTLYCTPPYINYDDPKELSELETVIREQEQDEVKIRRIIAGLEDYTADLDERIYAK
jgi:hypothetical protein